MVVRRKEGDLCTAYRPQTFTDIVGQAPIVISLRQAILNTNRARCYLFSGESGCGKTTMARIMGMALNCLNLEKNGDPCCLCSGCKSVADRTNMDFHEINASSKTGINDIRLVEQELKSSPLFGNVKIYVFDEAHRLSSEAQNALLKDTEDMSEGVYIFLCSTEPDKIIDTLKNRCESYKFGLLSTKDISTLIETVGVYENFYTTKEILNAIIINSEKRPRNALKLLQQVINLSKELNISEEDIIKFISNFSETQEDKLTIDLFLALVSDQHVSWNTIMGILKKIDTDNEAIRICLAGLFRVRLEKASSYKIASLYASALSLLIDPLPYIKPENKLVLIIYNIYNIFKTHG